MFLKKLFQKVNKNIHVGKDAAKLLHNKYVLYGVAGVAFVNLLLLLIDGDIYHAIIFLILGFLTSFFSKNMVVILAIALAATNLIKFGLDYAKEGMENTDEQLIKEHGTGEGEGMTEKLVGQDDEEEHKEGLEDEEEHKEGLEDEEEHKEGLVNEDDEEGKNGSKNTMEGMQPLGYSSLVPNLLEDQATLFTNIGQLTPYVIKAENASIQETKMKYENFRPAK
jgi:hypothetical protein